MIDEDVDIVELYKIILALSEIVLAIEERTNDDSEEWFNINISNNKSILREFIRNNSNE